MVYIICIKDDRYVCYIIRVVVCFIQGRARSIGTPRVSVSLFCLVALILLTL